VRVTIVAPGSRGDIQPYLALGVGLTRRGHAAKVVTTLDHAALVAASGLDFVPVAIDVQAALRGDRAAGRLEGGGVIASFRELGVGPAPVPRPKLTAERLARAIEQATGDAAMAARAAALGERVRAEDGIGRAVAAIERIAGERGGALKRSRRG
jgi:UDP:flavonoid glycosyltransferase YjiC (YdhE family)